MNRLERRYRLVLRMLPQWYRDDREEEMTATFLTERTDDHDLEYAWPGWRETGAVAALGIRARLAGDVGPARALVWGKAVRLVALIGLLVFTAEFLGWELAIALRGLPAGPTQTAPLLGLAGIAAWALPGVAFVAVALGHRAMAKVLAGLGFVGILATRIAHVAVGDASWPVLIDARMWLLLGVPVLCLVLGFHREAPPVRAKVWLIALAVSTATIAAVALGQLTLAGPHLGNIFLVNLASWAFVVGALGYLLAQRRRPAGQVPAAWLCALAVLGVLSSAVSVQSVIQYYPIAADGFTTGQRLLTISAVESVAVLIVTVAVMSAARRRLRRLSFPIAEAGSGWTAPTPA